MRKARGRNAYTKNNVKRAIAIARETGVGQVEIETPEGTKYTFHVNKELKTEDKDRKRWDELTEQAVRNPPRARERGK
jgi:hypothetical protein